MAPRTRWMGFTRTARQGGWWRGCTFVDFVFGWGAECLLGAWAGQFACPAEWPFNGTAEVHTPDSSVCFCRRPAKRI
jgi:hypothetical protein